MVDYGVRRRARVSEAASLIARAQNTAVGRSVLWLFGWSVARSLVRSFGRSRIVLIRSLVVNDSLSIADGSAAAKPWLRGGGGGGGANMVLHRSAKLRKRRPVIMAGAVCWVQFFSGT